MLLVLILGLAVLGAACYMAVDLVTRAAHDRRVGLERATRFGEAVVETVDVDVTPSWLARAWREAHRLIEPLAGITLRLNPKSSRAYVRTRLLAAGLGGRLSPDEFLATKLALGLSGLVLGAFLGSLARPAMVPVAGICLGCLGFLVPELVLTSRGRERRERIERDLPKALDLLAVSVEAGLGFDAALAKLVERTHGPLAEEFALILSEIRVGKARVETLRDFSGRLGSPAVRAFSRALIQADQLGTSLSRTLRTQASESRLLRQATVEEIAQKAPIKMIFPTALFIFPVMFIVILGPALINLGKYF